MFFFFFFVCRRIANAVGVDVNVQGMLCWCVMSSVADQVWIRQDGDLKMLDKSLCVIKNVQDEPYWFQTSVKMGFRGKVENKSCVNCGPNISEEIDLFSVDTGTHDWKWTILKVNTNSCWAFAQVNLFIFGFNHLLSKQLVVSPRSGQQA